MPTLTTGLLQKAQSSAAAASITASGGLSLIARNSLNIVSIASGTHLQDMALPSEPVNVEDKERWTGFLTQIINTRLECLPKLNDNRLKVPDNVFVHTNESEIGRTRARLENWTEASDQFRPIIHLGVGSVANYGMALSAKADYILISDIDERVVEFHHKFLNRISAIDADDSGARFSLLHDLRSKTGRDNNPDYSDIDWSADADNLKKLQQMIKADRVHVVTANITDTMTLVQNAKDDFAHNKMAQPKVVLYTSNVGDWIAGRNTNQKKDAAKLADHERFRHQANTLKAQDGFLIYASVINDSDSGYIQMTATKDQEMQSFDKSFVKFYRA